jgi:hypothetical protein
MKILASYRAILIVLLFAYSNVFAGIFSPSNFEECVHEVSKSAKTDLGVTTGYANCEKQFNKANAPVKSCYVTWNGTSFVKGEPANRDQFMEIRLKNTNDRIFFPEQMNPKKIKELAIKNFDSIKKHCPNLTLE